MAVTIETEPQDFNTVNNPCVFTFSSDQTTEDNFSFYVELTVNGTVDSFHTIFPESNNYGKFDATEILRSTVYSDLNVSGDYVNTYTSASCTYSIRVQEKYGDPPVLAGTWYGSNTVTGINGALKHQDWIDYDYTNFDATTQDTGNALWLNRFPFKDYTQFCGLNESVFLHIICTDTSAQVIVTLYDVTGSTIATTTDVITLPSTDYVMLNVSPQALIDNTSLTSTNFDTCYYYGVKFDATGAGANDGFSSEYKIYIDTECTQYTTRRLHWLNKYGAWDSFTFRLYSEETARIKSNKYEQERGIWNGSNEWVYNLYAGQRKTYRKHVTEMMTLNSDWMHQAVQQWLVEGLLESPKVYLEVDESTFEQVNVETNSYKKKQRIREGLIREEVKVERTYTHNSQLA